MLKTLFGGRTIVPNLVVAQRVLDKILVAANQYIEDETGEAMAGLVVSGEDTTGVPTVYILDTIAPDDSAIRHLHTFQQGDSWQDEMFTWLYLNWENQRPTRKPGGLFDRRPERADKWDAPLVHVGDWHKQPGNMIAPSGGDLMTALDILSDRERQLDFLLAPIVTLDHPATVGSSEDVRVNFVTLPQPQEEGLSLRVDFWYIDRQSRMFLPIHPAIYPDHKLPKLAPRPWRLVDEDRYNVEMAQLQGDGLFTASLPFNMDGKPPLEDCLMIVRQGASKVLLIGTHWDYPNRAPMAFSAPFMSMGENEVIYDVFMRMWARAEPVKPPADWEWTPERYLIDYVHMLEDTLGIERPAIEVATAGNADEAAESAPETAESAPETGDVGTGGGAEEATAASNEEPEPDDTTGEKTS